MTPETLGKLQDIADAADRDLGINATTNGEHVDWRHGLGQGVDIGFINGRDIGFRSTTFPGMESEAGRLQGIIAGMSSELRVASNLGPVGKFVGESGPLPIQSARTRDAHRNHIHVSFDRGNNRRAPSAFNLFGSP